MNEGPTVPIFDPRHCAECCYNALCQALLAETPDHPRIASLAEDLGRWYSREAKSFPVADVLFSLANYAERMGSR